jgi:phage FluMu protein Com
LLAKLARQDQEMAYVFLNKVRAKVNQTIPVETETDVKKINKFKNFKAINNQLYDFLEEFIG